jgi:DNA-binding transcriptional LysR family regulator
MRSGRYVSVLPTSFDAAANGIEAVPIGSPTIRRELSLVMRKDADLMPPARHFIELAKQLAPSVSR